MKRALIAGLFGAVAFLGCSFQRPLSYQNVALGPQERPITTVKGEASADYLLGFQMDGDDTYAAAIEDAKARVGVEVGTLYNVFVDRRIVCFPFCSFAIVTNVTNCYQLGNNKNYNEVHTTISTALQRQCKPFHLPFMRNKTQFHALSGW